jgi:hypothetical protein
LSASDRKLSERLHYDQGGGYRVREGDAELLARAITELESRLEAAEARAQARTVDTVCDGCNRTLRVNLPALSEFEAERDRLRDALIKLGQRAELEIRGARSQLSNEAVFAQVVLDRICSALAQPTLQVGRAPECGAKDPLSDRRCALPLRHAGDHDGPSATQPAKRLTIADHLPACAEDLRRELHVEIERLRNLAISGGATPHDLRTEADRLDFIVRQFVPTAHDDQQGGKPVDAPADRTHPPLTFALLRAANAIRQREWDAGNQITLAYRGNELAGEVGEACNELKKLERERLGIKGSRTTIEKTMQELADVVICSDLAAMAIGGDLGAAVASKFNNTSTKVGLGVYLMPGWVGAKDGSLHPDAEEPAP